jgi:hypothetical protein
VRRFIIVPICSKRLFILPSKFWFTDEVGLCVFGWLEFYFALLYIFYIEYVLVIWGQASVLAQYSRYL